MKFTTDANIYHIGTTTILDHAPTDSEDALYDYLDSIQADSWRTDATSDHEELIEAAGRMCYRSWKVGLNPNITKIRSGNSAYIANILSSGHFSVIEHAYDTYLIDGISRVATHELVRHRHCNFSQESLRYVRVEEVGFYLPKIFDILPSADEVKGRIKRYIEEGESLMKELAEEFRLDDSEGLPYKDAFSYKKAVTSAIRRLLPSGMTTAIIVTSNHRNWRHMIEARTSRYAEEEIREIFSKLYLSLKGNHPNIYSDAREETVDGHLEVKFGNACA